MLALRPYQQAALDDVLPLLAKNRRVMLQLATGGGKTEIGFAVAAHYLRQNAPVWWLTHRVELVEQALRRGVAAGLPVVDTYTTRQVRGGGHLHVVSIGRFKRHQPSTGLIVVDEAHHATAKTWARALNGHTGPVLGLTATPWRMSRREGFDALFADLYPVEGGQTHELQAAGYLAPLELRKTTEVLDAKAAGVVTNSTGEWSASSLEKAFAGALVDVPVHAWEAHATQRRTIIYATSAVAAQSIAEAIAEHPDGEGRVGLLLSDTERLAGVSDTVATHRDDVVARFGRGDLSTVVNVSILTEGYDCPGADTVVIARHTRSLALYRQMVGRALRPQEGKKALVLDCTGACSDRQVGHPLEPVEWSLAPRGAPEPGEAPMQECGQCGGLAYLGAVVCPGCEAALRRRCDRCGQWRSVLAYTDADEEHCNKCEGDIKLAKRTAEREARIAALVARRKRRKAQSEPEPLEEVGEWTRAERFLRWAHEIQSRRVKGKAFEDLQDAIDGEDAAYIIRCPITVDDDVEAGTTKMITVRAASGRETQTKARVLWSGLFFDEAASFWLPINRRRKR